jgi:beta-lactamase class A
VLTRRALLGGLLLLPAAACGGGARATPAPSASPSGGTDAAFVDLERAVGARLGVFARETGSGAAVAYRADERFPLCSTHKVLAAAAVLRREGVAGLGRRVTYPQADVLSYAPVTAAHVAQGMTLGELCDAAIRVSDNTAANLLLRELGGPPAVTAFARSLGDAVTRLDRTEPDLNAAVPGDPRDTTTPRALADDLQALTVGTALSAAARTQLVAWLDSCTTGAGKIRAAVPAGWAVGDKTGSGSYGTSNDLALLRPPGRAPIVVTVLSTGLATADAAAPPDLLARAARVALSALGESPAA